MARAESDNSLNLPTIPRREALKMIAMAAGGVAFSFLTPPIVRAQTAESAPGPYSDLNTEPPASPAWISERFEGGIRYTQDGKNYFVVSGEIQRAFEDQGGEAVWGRPVSGAWRDDIGRWNQAFEKGIFQVKDGKVEWMNIFDEANRLGYDPWLDANRQVPPAQSWSSDKGKTWPETIQAHLTITDSYPALRAFIEANPDWINQYGLPVAIEDYGPWVSLRMQRTNLQLLNIDTPDGNTGDVLVANGGTVAREATMYSWNNGLGQLIPPEALYPRQFEYALGKFESRGNLERGFEVRRYYKGDKLEVDMGFASPQAEEQFYQAIEPRLKKPGSRRTVIKLISFDDPFLANYPAVTTWTVPIAPYTPIFRLFGGGESIQDPITGQNVVVRMIGVNEEFFLNKRLFEESARILKNDFTRNIGTWSIVGLIKLDGYTKPDAYLANIINTKPLVIKAWPKGHPEDVRILPP